MNGVDLAILVIIGFSAVAGLRRGFMLGMVDLCAFGLALIAGARLADSISVPLADWGLPRPLASGAGFFVAVVVAYAVLGLGVRLLLSPLGAFGAATPLGWANTMLGLLPGAVRGLAIAALVAIGLSALPAELGLRTQFEASELAGPLTVTGRQALDDGLSWAGVDLSALGIPGLTSPAGNNSVTSGTGSFAIDVDAERTLIELVNQERQTIGLAPLDLDARLAAVGREHNAEMFAFGFFSHESPTFGNQADRLAKAGLQDPLFGENIALAPNATLAHEGLMNSPPYRANILNPGYTRIGISALRSPDRGLMVVEEFAGP